MCKLPEESLWDRLDRHFRESQTTYLRAPPDFDMGGCKPPKNHTPLPTSQNSDSGAKAAQPLPILSAVLLSTGERDTRLATHPGTPGYVSDGSIPL